MYSRQLYILLTIITLICPLTAPAQQKPGAEKSPATDSNTVIPGDCRLSEYLPLLNGKKVALLINQTSLVGTTLLVDTLLKNNVNVVKIFVPEHGLRGSEDAGATVNNSIDKETHLPVISLYGKNTKPTKEQLKDVDVVIYDLQDVGVRFYTYISTLQYMMEACAENHKTCIVLDRPNPNGFYVDGPVLDTSLRSFVGMQPIPIVYGMTAGEYAGMLVGERWFAGAGQLDLKVISCSNYDHTVKYTLPVQPSPNLRNMAAVYSYPSLCLFEGTVISVGRGTDLPFQVWGNPDLYGQFIYSFTPRRTFGSKAGPLYEDRTCYGQVVANNASEALKLNHNRIALNWLFRAYKAYPYKDKFFNAFFEKLTGDKELRQQITNGVSESEIRKTWEPKLLAFKKIRKKYLLYADF